MNGATVIDTTYYTSSATQSRGNLWGTDSTSTEVLSKEEVSKSQLGKDDFLKLLLAQLQHQDPLNPADNTEFVAQLAQFSSLEQMTQMNSNLLKSLESNTQMSEAVNNAMLISYIGKDVTAETSAFQFDGDNPSALNFTVDSDIQSGTLTIFNADETAVVEIALDGYAAGENAIEWNGVTKFGTIAKAGSFSYEVDAYDVLGNKIDATYAFSGKVDGVTFNDGAAHLKIGDVLIPFGLVRNIANTQTEAE